jgi:non-ribosomal peptide synthase protein (TIGR01720 family)
LFTTCKATARGLRIGIRDFFANPTVAGLAGVVNDTAGLREIPGEQLETAGLPLLPRQLAFLTEHCGTVPEQWNYAMLFQPAAPMDQTALQTALAAVIRRHDGLRVGFTRGGDGWAARVAAVTDFSVPFTWSDLNGLPPGEQQTAIENECRSLQTSLRLAGPLFRVAYFSSGTPDGDRLFVVGHWLLWDGYSVQVFLDDLLTGHNQVLAGAGTELPPATPLTRWARDLAALSANHAFDGEIPYWESLLLHPAGAIPADHDRPNLTTDERTKLVAVGAGPTAALLRLADNSGTTVTDVLLTATARSVAAWAGLGLVRVDVDGHGRDRPGITADPSRTIGRLSVRRPLDVMPRLEAGLIDAARGTTAGRRAVSQDGANYDILAYLDGHGQLLATGTQVLFNYLGRLDGLWAGGRLRLASEDPGPAHAHEVTRGYPLDLMLGVSGENLLIACTYSSACHDEKTIERLLDAVVADIHDAFGFPAPADDPPEPPGVAMLGHWLRGQ